MNNFTLRFYIIITFILLLTMCVPPKDKSGVDYVKEIISELAMVHSCEMTVYERACIELPSFNNLDPSDAISFIQMVKHFEEIA